MNRTAMRAQAGVTDRRLVDVQPQVKPIGNGAQHCERGGSDFGADPVAGKNKEMHGYLGPNCGCHHHFFFDKEKSRENSA
jgi:hypothetical protein